MDTLESLKELKEQRQSLIEMLGQLDDLRTPQAVKMANEMHEHRQYINRQIGRCMSELADEEVLRQAFGSAFGSLK